MCSHRGVRGGGLRRPFSASQEFTKAGDDIIGAGVAQLVSARPSELEVSHSILGHSNVCFDFLLIRVALVLNTRKTEHLHRKGAKCVPLATNLSVKHCHVLPSLMKVARPFPFYVNQNGHDVQIKYLIKYVHFSHKFFDVPSFSVSNTASLNR